ncbi:MAG: hypothetical protein HND46_01810 [Chloroflexi bacterium]|nr:hypothetical protein [Chloroflexota bacterium]NOG62129.1 hypothetical protein [Chloroflexota bacterium]
MTEELLLKSVQLAKEGQQGQARQLVEAYTRQNPLDARGWWVMANIVEDRALKQTALKHVLELKPYHAKARAMLEELEIDAVFSIADLPPPSSHLNRSKIQIRPADLLLVGGALLIVVLFVLAVGWYAYTYQHSGLFGLFGPDLSNKATTIQYSIHYPKDWEGKIINFQTQNQVVDKVTVAASYGIDSIVPLLASQPSADAAISVLTGDDPIGLNSSIVNQSDSNLSDEESKELLQSFGLVIFAPVSPEQLAEIQAQFESNAEDMESLEFFGINFDIHTETKEVEVDGEEATMTSFNLSLQFPEEFAESSTVDVNEINISYYLATTQHNGQAYAFFMLALEESPGGQARTARRMIRSIQFEN